MVEVLAERQVSPVALWVVPVTGATGWTHCCGCGGPPMRANWRGAEPKFVEINQPRYLSMKDASRYTGLTVRTPSKTSPRRTSMP